MEQPTELAEQELREIHQALRDLRRPQRLRTSKWLSSSLVSKRLEREPGKSPVECLVEVLAEVLQALGETNREAADLLHGRYWEGLTQEKMVDNKRPREQGLRTFAYQQEAAVEDFANLLWEREQTCKRKIFIGPEAPQKISTITMATEASVPPPLTAPLNETGTSNNSSEPFVNRFGTWLILGGALGLITTFIIVGSLLFRPSPDPQLSPTKAAIVSTQASATPNPLVGATGSGQPPFPSLTPFSPICGESKRVTASIPELFRSQGVTAYTVENTKAAVLNDKVRSLIIDPRGLWIGYFATDQNPINGVGQYDRKDWATCVQQGQGRNANALILDLTGRIWVGMEHAGIMMFDGQSWRTFTTRDGLPSDEIYGLTVDDKNNVWAGTWEGVAKYDGQAWTVPFTMQNNTIFDPRIHAIAFDSSGNIWIGHIGKGISEYKNSNGKWVYYATDNCKIGGDLIRSIVVRKPTTGSNESESVWIATEDGGVTKYENDTWTVYGTRDGLPSNAVRNLAIDKYNRVWAATSGGVVYWNGSNWVPYNTLATSAIAFGPNCQNCPYNDEHVWTATDSFGVTQSRLPYPDDAIDVVGIKFINVETREQIPWTGSVLTPTLSVMPGTRIRPEFIIRPRTPYTLTETRGDFLSNIEDDPTKRLGTYQHIAVKGTVESGQSYTFTDYDNPIKVPLLPNGENQMTLFSTWRTWMWTRYTGPYIRITLQVRRTMAVPSLTATK